MKNFNVSEFLHFQKVDNERDITIGWNRFFPTIFILNRFALELLEAVKNKKTIQYNEEIEHFFNQLLKYKFIYLGRKDSSKDDFVKMMADSLGVLKKKGDDFFRLKKTYEAMTIFNNECNLACSYCVNQYKRKHVPAKKKTVNRWKIINDCIEQFVLKKAGNSAEPVKISFNGGEILLEWKLTKKILQWLTEKCKTMNFEFNMNTNLSLMTEEIAKSLAQYNFKLDISIDGYKRAHDKTRKYHNGKGSFADILRGLTIYRKFNEKNPINTFQGTLEYIDDFNPEEVYRMQKHGFLLARLAPNLLNVSREDALKKARLMGKFLELNNRNSFQVKDLFFSKAKERINQDEYYFSFNCQGLSCHPHMTIYLNISTLQVSLLCAYVHNAWVPLKDLEYDIYNPKLWHRAYRFIEGRVKAIKKYCFDCHLVGLCSGGCIYTGLDNENQVNKAACTYQKKLWAIYIQSVYNDRKQS
jgi:radical SAM protein with 4Fe4S-binding SPASM domain